ncbi:MAG: hypothetical protein RB191_01600 [Terriglobia bacterium]|nr:hypothetical protein [Terriglobia bacterium]
MKNLTYEVNVDEPDVRFGNMLLEHFGGTNGELFPHLMTVVDMCGAEIAERQAPPRHRARSE